MKYRRRCSFLGSVIRRACALRILSLWFVASLIVLSFVSFVDAYSFNRRSIRTTYRSSHRSHRRRVQQATIPSSKSLQMCIDRDVDQELQDLGSFVGEKVDRDTRWMTGIGNVYYIVLLHAI